MGSMQQAILIAFNKGYTVTNDGRLLNINGKELVIRKSGKQKYPTFSINVGDLTKSGVYGIPVHKFAAYCFYGDRAFIDGIVVRHVNGNTEDISKPNILLGTHSDNNLDKSKSVRISAARIARASQGKRPKNSRFTDDEVRYIKQADKKPSELAKELNVTKQCIWLIKNGRNYSDVK